MTRDEVLAVAKDVCANYGFDLTEAFQTRGTITVWTSAQGIQLLEMIQRDILDRVPAGFGVRVDAAKEPRPIRRKRETMTRDEVIENLKTFPEVEEIWQSDTATVALTSGPPDELCPFPENRWIQLWQNEDVLSVNDLRDSGILLWSRRDTPQSIARRIRKGIAPHTESCNCVLCAIPRNDGWGQVELERRVQRMGDEVETGMAALVAMGCRWGRKAESDGV